MRGQNEFEATALERLSGFVLRLRRNKAGCAGQAAMVMVGRFGPTPLPVLRGYRSLTSWGSAR